MKVFTSRIKKTNYVFFWFAIYTLTLFIYKDFGIPTFLGYGLLALLILFAVSGGDGIVSVTSLTICFGILTAFESMAIIVSFFISHNTNYILYIPALLLCLMCIILTRTSTREIDMIIKIWFLIAMLLAFYVVLVAVNDNFFFRFIYPFLSTQSKEMASFQINLGYGVCIGANSVLIDYIIAFPLLLVINAFLIFEHEDKSSMFKFKLILVALLLFGAMTLENRKSELLAIALVIMILVLSGLNYERHGKRQRMVLLALLFVVCVLPFCIFVLYKAGYLGRYEAFIQRLTTNVATQSNVDISTGRLRLWKIAWKLFKEHPLFGIGWGNFSNYVPTGMQSGHENIFELRNVHNCYLQLLCETGVTGFLIFVTPLIYVLGRSIKMVRSYKTDPEKRYQTILASTCTGYQLFFLIVGFIDPSWYKLIFLCLYSLTVMMLNYLNRWETNYEI